MKKAHPLWVRFFHALCEGLFSFEVLLLHQEVERHGDHEAAEAAPKVYFSIIMLMISLSVSFMPTRPRRLMLWIVFSTPFFTRPSPP